jgi:hypothetical protein
MANYNSDNAIHNNSDASLPLLLLLLIYRRRRYRRIPSNRRWTGQEVVDDLNCGNTTRTPYSRMQLEAFNQFRDWLVNNTKLNS